MPNVETQTKESGAPMRESQSATQAAQALTQQNIAPQNLTEVQWHFAIPIYTKLIPGFSEKKEDLLNLINTHCGSLEQAKNSSLNTWQSHSNLHLLQDETIQWLTQAIAVMAKDCIGSRHPQWSGFNIMMDACWANVLGNGGWQAPHNHYPSQWSGVLYVSIEDSIQQSDPSDQKSSRIDFFNPIPISAAFSLPSSVTYTPKDGLMILFPALLQHMIHPNMSDAERFSIGFNLNVVPQPN